MKDLLQKKENSYNNAKHCYNFGIKHYNWDKSKREKFNGQGKYLFAENIDNHSMSVWCICYSNFNENQKPEYLKWKNSISTDKKTITEEYLIDEKEIRDFDPMEKSNRIVFVCHNENVAGQSEKNKYKYYFYGIYSCTNIERNNEGFLVKTYTAISTTYPFACK